MGAMTSLINKLYCPDCKVCGELCEKCLYNFQLVNQSCYDLDDASELSINSIEFDKTNDSNL
jgi:hypothetical protein